ncbi:MAG: hypothetical protein RLZZ458_2639 [Planctomycetota bacterium]
MKNVLTMAALVAAVAVYAPTGQAANVSFSGVLNGVTNIGQNVLADGDSFTLDLDFTPTNTSTANVITNLTTLTITSIGRGTKTLVFNAGSTGGITLSTISTPNGNKTQAAVNLSFTDNANFNTNQPIGGTFNFVMIGTSVINPLEVTQANMSRIFSPLSTFSGTLTNLFITNPASNSSGSFSGAIAVPEPGSIGLLTGLGCVVGRRLWRRRQQKQTVAAT